MNDVEDRVREYARLRVAGLFKLQPDEVALEWAFGEELKANFVSDFRTNEFDQIDHDIRDVADRKVLKELSSGALIIRTVGDYCEHMVRCYRTKQDEVRHVLNMDGA